MTYQELMDLAGKNLWDRLTPLSANKLNEIAANQGPGKGNKVFDVQPIRFVNATTSALGSVAGKFVSIHPSAISHMSDNQKLWAGTGLAGIAALSVLAIETEQYTHMSLPLNWVRRYQPIWDYGPSAFGIQAGLTDTTHGLAQHLKDPHGYFYQKIPMEIKAIYQFSPFGEAKGPLRNRPIIIDLSLQPQNMPGGINKGHRQNAPEWIDGHITIPFGPKEGRFK
jgi:hypothetical protein